MRGRNRSNNKGPNPLTRSYESNGPDVKIRGTAQHIAEKYSQLARDAQSSGDPVAAENYHQHAEHYYRIIATAQEQLREQYGYQRPFDDEDGDDDGFGPGDRSFGNDDGDFGSQPQPFEARQDGGRPADDRRERFDRNGGDRRERFNRAPRDTNRPDGNRPDGNRQDSRPDGRSDSRPDARPDFQRDDRQASRPEAQRDDRQAPRPERSAERTNGRGDFRRDRREEQPQAEDAGSSLPAFLTNPVRAPILAVEGTEASASGAPEIMNGEGNGEYRTRRRRRTRRGFGDDAAPESAADFVPEVETPPAE
jgi:hypothetical protein